MDRELLMEANMYCYECKDITHQELYDENELCEVWECTQCGYHEIFAK